MHRAQSTTRTRREGQRAVTRLRLLHAIHDFLPRHVAGSEIYALELCRELARRHDVFVVTAEYDPAARHGTIRWRAYEGLPVIEIVNNWEADRFEDTYASARMTSQLTHVLDATRPQVLHVHNLLNLSFDLPRVARARGIATVATLHDYTLVCASGGQRVHVAESHVCHEIDTDRCSRCFRSVTLPRADGCWQGCREAPGGGTDPLRSVHRPQASAGAHRRCGAAVCRGQSRQPREHLAARFSTRKTVFRRNRSVRSAFRSLARASMSGSAWDERRIEVSDYGFTPPPQVPRDRQRVHVKIGFVGTMAWHKGAHVLIDAVSRLRGAFEVVIAGDPNVGPEYHARLKRARDRSARAIRGHVRLARRCPAIYGQSRRPCRPVLVARELALGHPRGFHARSRSCRRPDGRHSRGSSRTA